MGRLAVKWVTISVKLSQSTQRVGHLQKGPINVMPQPAKQLIGIGFKVHHAPAIPKMPAVGTAQNSSTASRQNPRRLGGQGVDSFFFNVPKTVFPLTLEKLPNRTTQALLNNVVGVRKGNLQAPGQVAPDSCFS